MYLIVKLRNNIEKKKTGGFMLKAVFFDLDGTLLPLDEEKITKLYLA